MLIDLHVHTSRYSGCGKSSPEQMVARAQQLGIEAMVFTEHHVRWPQPELDELRARFPGMLLLGGVEIESQEHEDLLLYGVPDDIPVYRQMPAAEVFKIARAYDGFVTLAHPFRYGETVSPEVVRGVDAIEVMSIHILDYGRAKAQAVAESSHLLPLAASDAHHVSALGLYALRLDQAPATMRALIATLRGGSYTLYSDQARIREGNELAAGHLEDVEHAIGEGKADWEVANAVPGYTAHMVSAVRKHLDYLHPLT